MTDFLVSFTAAAIFWVAYNVGIELWNKWKG